MSSAVRVAGSALMVVGCLLGAVRQSDASAITILNIQGTSAGCFDCTSASLQSGDLIGGLTFDASSFNITTDATGSALANIGTFTLSGTQFNYASNQVDFLLGLAFSVPAGTTPGEYTAHVEGSINTQQNGSVNIQFDHAFQTFTFTTAQGTGSFEFGLADPNFHLRVGDPLQFLVASIRNAQFTANGLQSDPDTAGGGGSSGSDAVSVPEPASLLLMAAGLGATLRRRSANRERLRK